METTLHGPFGRKILGPAPLTIGQASDNQLVIADPKVSARHAEIRPAGQGYTITDSGSTNGTYVNGQWLTRGVPRMLNQGDTIRIGDTTLTYVLSSAQPSGNIPSGGSTQRADNVYQPVGNPYQPIGNPYQDPPAPPHTGYGWGAQQQQATPAAPPPPYMQPAAAPSYPTPSHGQLSYTPIQQPVSPPKPKPWLWIVLGIVATVLLISGVGTFAYINSLSTTTKTLDMFCADLQSKDYPSAYNLMSVSYQAGKSESQFANAFSPYQSCTHSAVDTSNGNAAATITFASAPWDYQASLLKDSNGVWKINGIVALPDLMLNMFCDDIQRQDYQAAYNLTSGRYQTNIPESQFAKPLSTYTSCMHSPAETSNGNATATITFGNAPWDYRVPLLKDSNGAWKIDDFVGLPDLTLATFCDDVQKQDYQAAYSLTSGSYQNGVPESRFANVLSHATSCTFQRVSVTPGGTVQGGITLGFSDGSSVHFTVPLIKDSNGGWKINDFIKS